jgi:hypothetical protein
VRAAVDACLRAPYFAVSAANFNPGGSGARRDAPFTLEIEWAAGGGAPALALTLGDGALFVAPASPPREVPEGSVFSYYAGAPPYESLCSSFNAWARVARAR